VTLRRVLRAAMNACLRALSTCYANEMCSQFLLSIFTHREPADRTALTHVALHRSARHHSCAACKHVD
jgi:hypothetical protein